MITISIDHGNRLIKTTSQMFPASYKEAGHLPALGADVLRYEGKEYHLTDENQPSMPDKTKNDRYYILTLFAIGKEIEHLQEKGKLAKLHPFNMLKVELLIGLPLTHFMEFEAKFRNYFMNRGDIRFELNGKPHTIYINDVYAYPQAYAAALTARDRLSKFRTVNIIDVGGFTVDGFRMVNLQPSKTEIDTLALGVNILFNEINERIRAKGKQNIPFDTIENILRADAATMIDTSAERLAIIKDVSQKFTDKMLQEVEQIIKLDLAENTTVFVGGGSLLLRNAIINTRRVSKPIFIDNIHANAIGYELIRNGQKRAATTPLRPNTGIVG